jgi:glutamate-1-semialdehyde 2,1-aminomutase
MLKNGYLTSNTIYVCISHNKKILKKYFSILDLCFKKINEFEKGKNVDNFLESPTCHSTFRRLN